MTLAQIIVIASLAFLFSPARADWRFESIGNVKYTHFYYEENKLAGICVASEEGVIALLDPDNGNIVWRNNPTIGRRLLKFVSSGRCIDYLYIYRCHYCER